MVDMAQDEFTLPVALIIDIVVNIYIFSSCACEIDEDFAQQFTIAHKIAESGPWWSLFYGKGLHTALNQISTRSKELVTLPAGRRAELSREEAAQFLPYLNEVREILALWRDNQEEEGRKRAVLALFSEEIQRFILPLEGDILRSQFYEEGESPRGSHMGDFFIYLDSCPLVGTGTGPVSLEQAAAYWAWIDNVKAFRTFAREENIRNFSVRRMQQAVQFHRLVEKMKEFGIDLSMITISGGKQAFLRNLDLEYIEVVADSYGSMVLFDYYNEDIFIEHRSLGEAIHVLKKYICVDQPPLEPSCWDYELVLKASVLNLSNHLDVLESKTIRDRQGNIIQPTVVITQLDAAYPEICGMIARLAQQEAVLSSSDADRGYAVLPLLEAAVELTNWIACNDPAGRRSSTGLARTIAVLKKQLGLQ